MCLLAGYRSLSLLLLLSVLVFGLGCATGGSRTSTPPPNQGGGTPPPPPPPPPPPTNAINHIIFLAEENRSFDHYFGKLNDYRSAAPFNLPREVDGLPDDCSSSNSDWSKSCSAMNMSP